MRRRSFVAVVVVLVTLTGLAACSSSSDDDAAAKTASRDPACPTSTSPRAGLSRHTITSQGQERSYLLYVPRSYTGRRPVPLVFEFHGFGSNADQQLVLGDFRPRAEKDGFVLVLPDGQGTPKHFNMGPFQLQGGGTDDVPFAVDLLDAVARSVCVDADRVYSTGMSNGAGMSLALACLAADRFAAVGPVAVMVYLPPCDDATRPVPVVAFVGTSDPIVPFAGGPVQCCGAQGLSIPPAETSAAQWAAHDGCTSGPTDTDIGDDVVRRSWRSCRSGADVDFHIVRGGGHTWPGSVIRLSVLGRTSTVSAVDIITDFFLAHPRRR